MWIDGEWVNAESFPVGPGSPFSPVLCKYGIHTPAGTLFMDPESVREAVQEGATRNVFEYGAQMVRMSREDLRD